VDDSIGALARQAAAFRSVTNIALGRRAERSIVLLKLASQPRCKPRPDGR
jgi:hypothetical protein